jgi:hypothetical protein
MGARGPVGKPKDSKAGHRTKEELGSIDVVDVKDIDPEILRAAEEGRLPVNEKWHEIAKHLYEAAARSDQRVFYQPTDWAILYVTCESLSRDLKPQFVGLHPETGEPILQSVPIKGAALAAYLKAFTALLMTEGDRRRLNLELKSGKVAGDPGNQVPDDGVVLDRAAMFRKKA